MSGAPAQGREMNPAEDVLVRRMRWWMLGIGGASVLLLIVFWFLHQSALVLLFGSTVVASGCALIAVSAGERPRNGPYVLQTTVMGVLTGLAPLSLVVYYRLSQFGCPVLNILSLPWAEPWREIAHWGSGLLWIASTAVLIGALMVRPLRRAAVAMWTVSLIAVVPTLILMFLTVYGDPGSYCVPG